VEVTLRQGEPLIRLDERYEGGGRVTFDLGAGLQPTQFATKADFRGNMQLTPLAFDPPTKIPSFVGWDFYLADRTSVLGLSGGPADDLLALLSTDPDWLPVPYQQMMSLTAEPGPTLTLEGPLTSGHRHWAFLVARGAEFPHPGTDLYRWWNQHLVIPLDKVANWQLTWPDMDQIEFPHTFFSKEDLPGIRQRLQAEPAIRELLEPLREKDNWWAVMDGQARDFKPEDQAQYARYKAQYQPRKGIVKGVTYVAAAYLYGGDPVYLEQLHDRTGIGDPTPEQYLDFFIRCYLEDLGPLAANGAMGNMNVSDSLLQRYVGMELLLGSDLLTPEEKRQFLTKLAFVVYVMHDPVWQPPVHRPDGSRPEGYGQGTPNQKHCAFSCRAITACMLANHPQKRAWLDFALAEVRAHYPWTIAESGALLESPFYTSRDTMRYAPFWSALTRAGCTGPAVEAWMNRPRKGFQYLADMLTPREPRMGGRRVYHPVGRSPVGVIDPTFMIGGDPWGLTDAYHAGLMRWCWEQQGKPSPDVLGTTGGRDLSLTLIAFSHPFPPLQECPLRSRRWEGMGAVLRSHPDSDYESNVLFRHDPFCWDLYPVNNGAVYFYGKGAPLLPRFGGYWQKQVGQCWMMTEPFGNRLQFLAGDNGCLGRMTDFAALGEGADFAAGTTQDGHWKRSVLFAKDARREDPVYLLVRDDVSRPGAPTALHWWVMSRDVQPEGLEKPGVVPVEGSDEQWTANLGRNWKDAPALQGQVHHFTGPCGVDLDLFLAVPAEPSIVTDAAGIGPPIPYCANPKLYEFQQLIRIEQPSEKPYLTLLAPRWPGSPPPTYRTIAEGCGVAVSGEHLRDRLFLADAKASYQDEVVAFEGRAGFARLGGAVPVRLMVVAGRISAGGITLASSPPAALLYDGQAITLLGLKDAAEPAVELAPDLKGTKVLIRRE
jgi:hypothetical protein